MLALLRRVPEIAGRMKSGPVPSITVLAPGLFGRTVGLVGMGDTAYHLALLLRAFNCAVLVCSPSSEPSRWRTPSERFPTPVECERVTLDELCRRSEVVSLHCPLTAGTRDMLGAREFSLMHDGVVVINTARGELLDEDALVQALKTGKVGGAGLDVFRNEPRWGDALGEFDRMDNVICLPHV